VVEEESGARVLRVHTLVGDPRVCRVDIEGAGQFRLDVETARALGLAEGQEISEAVLSRVAAAAARHDARTVALRLLQRRLRSRAEIEAALRRRSIAREAILAVSAELRSTGWIDDSRFARVWIQDRQALRPCGARRLRAELLAKGVAPQIAEEAIAALVPRATEDTLALEQARARLARLRGLAPVVARRRTAAWLQRRGYATDVIVRTLRMVTREHTDQPDVDPAA
jgi:regulatory protein